MSDRDGLIGSLLARPGDFTLRSIFADWHDDNDLPHQAALLRLSVELLTLPEATEPDEECRNAYSKTWDRWRTHRNCELNQNCLEGYDGPNWPMCHGREHGGWRDAARLVGFRAAYNLADTLDERLQDLVNRNLLRYELYSCGVLSEAERDEEHPTSQDMSDWIWELLDKPEHTTMFWTIRDWIWPMRSGRAGRAMNVMIHRESMIRYGNFDRPIRVPRLQRDETDQLFVLTRTHHRDLIRLFLSNKPWIHGRAISESRKKARR